MFLAIPHEGIPIMAGNADAVRNERTRTIQPMAHKSDKRRRGDWRVQGGTEKVPEALNKDN